MDLSTNTLQEVNFPSKFVEKFFWEAENSSYIALEVRNLSRELQTILDNESYEFRRGAETQKPGSKKSSSHKYIKPCKDIRRPWKNKENSAQEDEDQLGAQFSKKNPTSSGNENENYRKTLDIELPSGVDHAIITLFADSEKGILIHEKRTELNAKFLVGLGVPYIYLADNAASHKDNHSKQFNSKSSGQSPSLQIQIDVQVIPEFDGVEDEHKEGRAALMNYVYHTLFNDIDGALRAIRFIKKYG